MIAIAQQSASRAAAAASVGLRALFRFGAPVQERPPPAVAAVEGQQSQAFKGGLRERLTAGARALRQPVVAFGLALIVSFWIASSILVYQDGASLKHEAQRDAGNLVLVFEQYVSLTVAEIDRGLLFLRWAHGEGASHAEWQDIITQDFVSNRETAQTGVVDASGYLITSTALLRPPKPIWLGDREHFVVQRDSKDDRLFISKPVIGRISGRMSVEFSRKFTDDAGRFAGVVVISLDVKHLAHKHSDLNLGDRGGLALVGDDGVTRAGSGVFADLLGKPFVFPGNDAETARRSAGPTAADSLDLVMVKRQVRGAPLSVVVAAPNEANNPGWIARRHAYYAVALAASFVTILVTFAVAMWRQRAEERILYLARFNSLTNLCNRRQLTESLDALFALPAGDRAYALHIIDLDRFKYVNDTYGHPIGDALLKQVADRLVTLVPASDLVVRLGGDEFAILQSLRPYGDEARILANRICEDMAAPFEVGGARIVIGATVGVSLAAEDAHTASELLKAADLALYAAKDKEKGGYRLYDAGMARALHARNDIEAGLRTVIDKDELRLVYQPLIDLRDLRVIGYEALIRWIRPDRSMVLPTEFIPVAEETGLIVKIGDWVLDRACADIAALPWPVRASVNCSPIQFELSDVAASVCRALEQSGLPPDRLEIEITESALMKNNQRVLDQLSRLRAIGVRVSIDDFGAGFSSLSYLERFPITTIKIDRSFVQKLGRREGARATLRALIELASSYKMTALAEGVETEDQMKALIELGCDHAQGYLFGKPRPIGEVWKTQAVPPIPTPEMSAA